MEVVRVEDFDSGDIECIKCGKNVHLYFNGGELDSKECCGLIYATEYTGVDLVVTEIEKDENNDH